ncbi:MAG: LamG-like jellyroll fold domain-containing protein [Planctomycetia bacterium]|nr:LamG-like jellyroll fold domain-containing protein [Planctomycetia bacterium]
MSRSFSPSERDLIDRYLSGDLDPNQAGILLDALDKNPDLIGFLYDNIMVDYLLFLDGKKINDLRADQEILAEKDPNTFDRNELFSTQSDQIPLWNSDPDPELNRVLVREDPVEVVSRNVFFRQVPGRVNRSSTSGEGGFRKKRNYAGIGVVCALILFPLLVFLSLRGEKADPIPKRPTPMVLLEETIDAVWEPGTRPYKRGEETGPCRFVLKSGMIKLRLDNGSEIIAEGPNDLTLHNSKNLFCDKGKLSVSVSKEGIGFEIATPCATIVDLGTKFGVSIDDQGVRTDVVQGTVQLTSQKITEPIRLSEGSVAFADRKETIESISFDPQHFIDAANFFKKLFVYHEKIKETRRERSSRWLREPALVAFYDFSGNERKAVRNEARHALKIGSEARIHNGKLAEGSLPGLSAISLYDRTARISCEIPGNFSGLTLIANVRFDRLRQEGNILLAANSYFDKDGSIQWRILPSGSIQLKIRNEKGNRESIFTSDPFLIEAQPKVWYQLAVSADPQKKKIAFYVDGKLLSERNWNQPIPLLIGEADLGNFVNKKSITQCCLEGAIEEFCIFDRALEEAEINQKE